jgi:glycosyltransferase involved in cell wall biosynthesis/2-polyprenyl-3-methyl-5-hydroxy-6-metoxy-1,4-benzoquinol methylase
MLKLEQLGYTKDGETGVWVRADFQGIAYSDGDTSENQLAAIIRDAQDVSVLSDELPQHCTDWAKLYHLSATRGNILRPFEHLLKGSVLEIGAGCGAISRYLGECGADLLCLEGSPRRAAIASSRTRDLENVTVLAERFDDFKTEEKFDVVTLIGVLEYASMFSSAENPALAMLVRIRELLKPDGHLFIAIENQLGLKYFAGAPEDHLGIAMYGIEGRYEHGQPKTFGRRELEALISEAGYEASSFLSPFPDYKLPNSIITEHGFQCENFDAAALAWQNVKKDPQLPEQTNFNLEKAWPVVIENDLGMDLANSFLIAASCGKSEPIAKDILALHYSTGRKNSYCKETLFVKTPTGIEVRYTRLGGNSAAPGKQTDDDGAFRFILPRVDSYTSGTVLSQRFLQIASTRDWTVDEFKPFLVEYLQCLRTVLAANDTPMDLQAVTEMLPGEYIDAVPQNIVLDHNNVPSLIDMEWEMTSGVELGHLLMRALLLLMAAANPFYPTSFSISRREFIGKLLESVGLRPTGQDFDRYIAAEAAFQEQVTGKDASGFLEWAPDRNIHKLGTGEKVPAPKMATLYFSDEAGHFSEQHSLSRDIVSGSQQLAFSLAGAPTGCKTLRFDPTNARQPFAISRMSIRSQPASEAVWEWQDTLDAPIEVSGIAMIRKPDNDILFLSMNDDPYLRLPVDVTALGGFDSLEFYIDLTLFTEEQMVQQLSALNEKAINELYTDAQRSVELIATTNSDLTQRVLRQQDEIVQLFRQLNEATASSIANNANTNDLADKLEKSEAKIEELCNELNEVRLNSTAASQLLKDQYMLELEAKDIQINELIAKRALDDSNSEEERLQIIETLSEQVALKDEALQAMIEKWQLSLNDKDVHIANIEAQINGILTDRDTKIHHLNLQMIALHESTSWKVTAPIRKIGSAARRAKRAAHLIPMVVRRSGGLKRTLRNAFAIWKAQGASGLVKRIRNVNQASEAKFVDSQSGEIVDRHDYAKWVERYDTLTDEGRWAMIEEISSWARKPLISIIMPVYNPPLDLLEEAIESVKAQVYKHWELCIADDASTNKEVLAYLKAQAKRDRRIKVTYRKENGHISKASNSALELAKGQYVALMDNDDLLPAHALYWIARTAVEQPEVAVMYSDEDKIDVQGNRTGPYFKTDWNIYLFRSHNMVSHLGVYRRDLVESVGRFREGMEGSQDYDLALRCIEQVKPEQIVHIPHVLYHWRIHPGSTAMSLGEKPYAQVAGQKALDEHLQRTGISGRAELLDFGMYRVHYDLPDQLPLVSLIIPTRNAMALVRQCIESIKSKTTYQNYEIILVDNGSDDPESIEYFETLNLEPNIRVLRDDGPFNYSALNNRAVSEARGELIGLINNDIEVISPDWLGEMVSLALQPGAGAVGARLWYPDDRLQHGGIIMGPLTLAGHAHKFLPRGHHGYFGRASLIQGMSAVTAACLIVRKSTFEEVGGLNEIELKIAFNDVDFCLKVMAAGYQNIWTPNADLYHHESATRGLEDTPEKIQRFLTEVRYVQEKWRDVISHDPAYNPNLSFDFEDFSLAFPPRESTVKTSLASNAFAQRSNTEAARND